MDETRSRIVWDDPGDEEWLDEAPGREWSPLERAMVCTVVVREADGRIEPGSVGSCFFISPIGLFLTAKHVVTRRVPPPPSRIRTPGLEPPDRFDLVERLEVWQHSHAPGSKEWRKLQIGTSGGLRALAAHEQYDVAIGCVRLRPGVGVPALALGIGALPDGEEVVAHGFGGARTGVVPNEASAADFRPRPASGKANGHRARHHCGPVHVHTALVQGGSSGGPLVRASNLAAYGVGTKSLGGAGADVEVRRTGYAIDVAAIADWPIPFLEGMSLRDLSKLPRPVVELVE